MRIWEGAVTIGLHNDTITPLYNLNNFNGYPSGLLTMFNIFVVNDWPSRSHLWYCDFLPCWGFLFPQKSSAAWITNLAS